jgi:hypothetical protein
MLTGWAVISFRLQVRMISTPHPPPPPHTSPLPHLLIHKDSKFFSVLGLKGNNLTTETVSRLEEFLQEKDHFPSLLWITMPVNNAVNTFPKTLVHALVSRWPRWIRKNLPSNDIKLSPLDILQGRMPIPFNSSSK